jgi:hypothetical protein
MARWWNEMQFDGLSDFKRPPAGVFHLPISDSFDR